MTVEHWMKGIDGFLSESEHFRALLKKTVSVLMMLLVAYSVVRGVAAAASRPLWFDELLTLTIAGQPSLHEMWAAISRGFDSAPPPFYLLERFCLALPISKEISLRLPSILSFPLLLISVFTFAKRRTGELIAGLCALATLSTSLFHTYLIEARGYMLMNACIAFALVCYQRLPSFRWAAMLGTSLFLAQASHYYAIFAIVPFGLAEVLLFAKIRRFRWHVWAAMVSGVLPLVVFSPLLAMQRAYYSSNIFFRLENSFWTWTQYYGSFFFINGALGTALAAVSIAAILASRQKATRACLPETDRNESELAERMLLVGLILLPLTLFLFMRLIHGGMLDRHAMSAAIGIVLGIAFALCVLGARGVRLFALFIIISIGINETRFWRHNRNDPLAPEASHKLLFMEQFGQIEKFVQSGGHNELPVVFANALVYCQVVHYSPPDWTKRLFLLMDRSREQKYTNADTTFLNIKGLSEFYSMQLEDFDEFTKAHSEFLLYAERMEWCLQSLSADGASIQLLRTDGAMQLYLVKTKITSAD
jgi:Dolichyl-phosphate-mannose-protein mannosyltransferase